MAPQDDLGQLDLTLVGQAPSGTRYRLRDAEIGLSGPGVQQVLRTEDDPDRTSIRTRVAEGTYVLDLADGWRVERLTSAGAVTVAAQLVSPDPLPVDVVAGQLTQAVLRFRVDGATVPFGDGDIDVRAEFEESSTEPHAIVVQNGTVALREGFSFTFSALLARRPRAAEAVTITASHATVSPAVLTFTPASFATPQPVTVTLTQDEDALDGLAEILLSGAGTNSMFSVVVVDDDPRDIRATPAQVVVPEGGSGVVGVRLVSAPTANVDVRVHTPAEAIQVSPSVLTFTPDDWQVARTVVITAAEDADLLHEPTLSLDSPGMTSTPVPLVVVDND